MTMKMIRVSLSVHETEGASGASDPIALWLFGCAGGAALTRVSLAILGTYDLRPGLFGMWWSLLPWFGSSSLASNCTQARFESFSVRNDDGTTSQNHFELVIRLAVEKWSCEECSKHVVDCRHSNWYVPLLPSIHIDHLRALLGSSIIWNRPGVFLLTI